METGYIRTSDFVWNGDFYDEFFVSVASFKS